MATLPLRSLPRAQWRSRCAIAHAVYLNFMRGYIFYNNSQPANNYWLSNHTRQRLGRPIWEILYNHYVVRRGLEAPHTTAMAHLVPPEHGNGDHFGYGTVTFKLDAEASPCPPFPARAKPTNVAVSDGVVRVELSWTASIPRSNIVAIIPLEQTGGMRCLPIIAAAYIAHRS